MLGTIQNIDWAVEDTKTLHVYSIEMIKDENYIKHRLGKYGKITIVELYPGNFLNKSSQQSPKVFRDGKWVTLCAKVGLQLWDISWIIKGF